MRNRASCRWPAAGSSSATTPRRRWQRTACWWWPPTPAFAGASVVQAPNDKQQVEPMLGKIAELPAELGKVGELLADNGYFSEGNVNACAAAGIEPVIAMGREAHHASLDDRFAEPPPAPQDPTPLEAMAHRLKTPEGKKR